MSTNTALRAARLAAGLSQSVLAERVNVEINRATGKLGALDANTVSRLERAAIARPAQRTVDALCRVLRASESELGFGPAPAMLAPVAAAVEKPWKVGPDALGAVRTVLSGLRRLEDVTSSAAVLPAVESQVRVLRRFAREAIGTHRRNAVGLAAEASCYRGWLAIDLADWLAAERALNDATALAIEGGTNNLLVEAVGFKSYAALRRGDHAEAVDLRHAAQPLARTPVERAVASLHLARTLAITGDLPASDRALLLADRAIEESAGQPRDDHHYYVTDPWLIVQHGLVHAWAGRNAEARRDIETGLASMPARQRESEWAGQYRRILDRVS